MSRTLYACWTADRINKVLRTQATDGRPSDFLAAHTPMNGLVGEIGFPGELREEQVYDAAADLTNEHRLMVVHGPPGGGKSHLIRWLSLRLKEEADNRELRELVFIQRENSTLRKVLEQISQSAREVSDLWSKLQQGVQRLNEQGLLGRVQDEWARQVDHQQIRRDRLTDEEAVVLCDVANEGCNWGALLRDKKVGEILRSSNGLLDRLGRHIGSRERREEQQAEAPLLLDADLDMILAVPSRGFANEAARSAREYLEVVAETDEAGGDSSVSRRQVLKVLNDRLALVVQESLGISNEDLQTLFVHVRRRIHQENPHRRLVLLIEDMFPFTHLDQGLINVLIRERQADEDLAPLTAVVGMTTGYWEDEIKRRGRDYVESRISHCLKVRLGDAIGLAESEQAAGFVARYLNVVRHADTADLDRWAASDATFDPPSACLSCPHPQIKDACLREFGYVGTLENPYGLFPLTRHAVDRLVSSIEEGQNNTRSPRLLLNNGLRPLLNDGLECDEDEQPFPSPAVLAVRDLAIPPISNPSLKATIAHQLTTDAERSSVDWIVRLWGDGSVLHRNGIFADVPPAIFARFGIDLPEQIISDTGPFPPAPAAESAPELAPTPPAPTHPEPKRPPKSATPAAEPRPPKAAGEPKTAVKRAPPRSDFDPQKWTAEYRFSDAGRQLAHSGLAEAAELDRLPERTLIKTQFVATGVYVEGQQASRSPDHLVIPLQPEEKDALTAIHNATRLGQPLSAVELRSIRAYRSRHVPQAVKLLHQKWLGESDPAKLRQAAVWLLLLEGVLSGRVDTELPPRQWLFSALASEKDSDSGCRIPGFEELYRDLKNKVPRRYYLEVWDMLAGLSKDAPKPNQLAHFFLGADAVTALELFRAVRAPAELSGQKGEVAVGKLREGMRIVNRQFPGALRTIRKRAGDWHAAIREGAGHDVSDWVQALLELCAVVIKDRRDDDLRMRAQGFMQRLTGKSWPRREEIARWLPQLQRVAEGDLDEAFWRAALVFTESGLRRLGELHDEVNGFVKRVRERKAQEDEVTGGTQEGLRRSREAIDQLKTIVTPRARW